MKLPGVLFSQSCRVFASEADVNALLMSGVGYWVYGTVFTEYNLNPDLLPVQIRLLMHMKWRMC